MGVIPTQPGQAAAVGAEARRGIKVCPFDQYHCLAAGQRHGGQGIDRLAVAWPVVLAHTEEPGVGSIYTQVGVAQRPGGCERRGSLPRCNTVDALIFIVSKVDDAVVHGVVAAAVLVDAVVGAVAGRDGVLGRAGRPAHDDAAAAFLGAAFQPVDGLAILFDDNRRLRQLHGAG